jgi:hypothetical protein
VNSALPTDQIKCRLSNGTLLTGNIGSGGSTASCIGTTPNLGASGAPTQIAMPLPDETAGTRARGPPSKEHRSPGGGANAYVFNNTDPPPLAGPNDGLAPGSVVIWFKYPNAIFSVLHVEPALEDTATETIGTGNGFV